MLSVWLHILAIAACAAGLALHAVGAVLGIFGRTSVPARTSLVFAVILLLSLGYFSCHLAGKYAQQENRIKSLENPPPQP